MTTAPAYVDSLGSVKGWINSRGTTLVGAGHPLPRGVFLQRLHGPQKGAWGLLVLITTAEAWGDGSVTRNRLSNLIHGNTLEQASAAAVAYANELRLLAIARDFPDGTRCHLVDAITGPLYSPDRGEPRFLVDADFYLQPPP